MLFAEEMKPPYAIDDRSPSLLLVYVLIVATKEEGNGLFSIIECVGGAA
jgi:hypothetical protein